MVRASTVKTGLVSNVRVFMALIRRRSATNHVFTMHHVHAQLLEDCFPHTEHLENADVARSLMSGNAARVARVKLLDSALYESDSQRKLFPHIPHVTDLQLILAHDPCITQSFCYIKHVPHTSGNQQH